MFSWENPDDRVAIVQMNAELRHAQLELLSAECATQQLRLRFSIEDLARYAEQDLLHKAIDAASNLNEYYAAIERQITTVGASSESEGAGLSARQALGAVSRLSTYLRAQRERYFHTGVPLSAQHKAALEPFFSGFLLDRVRVVELTGTRIPNPPFYAEARALGFETLPELPHMASLTFLDVVVFNEKITKRSLFHGLVHAVQFQILGLERFSGLFVRGFLKTKTHFTVPLEAHAFALDAEFVQDGADSFSVEEQVRRWVREGRY
jgi:hypothetical protein